jgi:hypothetical protein
MQKCAKRRKMLILWRFVFWHYAKLRKKHQKQKAY